MYGFSGMKGVDGYMKRMRLKKFAKTGYVTDKGMVYPLALWTNKEVLQYIRQSGLIQPFIYDANAISQGFTIDLNTMLLMRSKYPNDYKRILKEFPYSEKLIFDYEREQNNSTESREIQRSDINFANYNPRKITQEARKNLKANLKRVGLLGGIVWNEVTGNLVSGHQRISVIDEVNKYNPGTRTNDYLIRVEVVHMDEKTEKEQNIFMNNRSVQGDFDSDMLKDMLDGIDYSLAGLNDFDLNMLGIGDLDFSINDDIWRKEDILDDSLSAIDEATKEGKENKDINRSNNFYEDSKENQIVRHNEVQKIKDRISNQNSFEKDNGMLSYVVLSFNSPTERANFMKMFGYGFEERYIDGKEFMDRIEFGVE